MALAQEQVLQSQEIVDQHLQVLISQSGQEHRQDLMLYYLLLPSTKF